MKVPNTDFYTLSSEPICITVITDCSW